MTLDELREIVVNSEVDDWNVMYCWGAHSGPSYRGRPSHEVQEMGDDSMRFDVHGMTAAYRPDVSITLAWGITSLEDFETDWARSVSMNHTVTSNFADLFYNGALVNRELYVVVDEGRAFLPLPKKVGGTEVNRWDYNFVRLLDTLEVAKISEYDGYFRRAGLTVAP